MAVFLNTALSFPTVVYTALLILCALFWLVGLIGGLGEVGDLDSDVADLDVGDLQGLSGLLFKLKLDGAPITLVLTLLSFFAWFCCYFVSFFVLSHLPSLIRYLAGALTLTLVLPPSVFVTAWLIRPLRRLYRSAPATRASMLVGKVAVVRSPVVDAQRGEACLDHDGATLTLQVRTDQDAPIDRGETVILIEYRPGGHSYYVIREQELVAAN